MADPVRLTIRADFPRAASEVLRQFADASSGHVVDAQGRRGALPYWIRPVTTGARFVGTALTVRTRPGDNLAPYAALRFARPGDVLVVSADGDTSCSLMGDVLIGMARNAGILAAVTDGLVRDVAGIEAVGIPVFTRGLSPNSPLKDGPGAVGVPVSLGGVIVEPGDLLVGDGDGVAVVPRETVEEAASELKAVAEKERAMEAAVSDGAREPAWLDAFLASDKVMRID